MWDSGLAAFRWEGTCEGRERRVTELWCWTVGVGSDTWKQPQGLRYSPARAVRSSQAFLEPVCLERPPRARRRAGQEGESGYEL